jgi:small subunit ribosomal protein S20
MKTNLKRQTRNRAARSTLKTTLKKYIALPVEERKTAFPSLQAALDKAARKGVIHRNKAARLKSRLIP